MNRKSRNFDNNQNKIKYQEKCLLQQKQKNI